VRCFLRALAALVVAPLPAAAQLPTRSLIPFRRAERTTLRALRLLRYDNLISNEDSYLHA